MQPRISNPATLLPGAMDAMLALKRSIESTSIPRTTLDLVHLRVSEINGCEVCIEAGRRAVNSSTNGDERASLLSRWGESKAFTRAEEAALVLAERMTLLAGRSDPVPDTVWNRLRSCYSPEECAALLIWVGLSNLFNRINIATRQQPGQW